LFCLIVVIIVVLFVDVCVVVEVCVDVVDTCSRSCRSFQLWHSKPPFELLIIFGNQSCLSLFKFFCC
jgi:hypothetical protein